MTVETTVLRLVEWRDANSVARKVDWKVDLRADLSAVAMVVWKVGR